MTCIIHFEVRAVFCKIWGLAERGREHLCTEDFALNYLHFPKLPTFEMLRWINL